ncbi:MAG: cupredoxin domain-containing protein [Patescibacteria group bacterium]
MYAAWILYTKKQKGETAKEEAGMQTFDILVKGVYSPSVIKAKMEKPIRINFSRQESTECSKFINFPDFHIREELPENKTITIEIRPDHPGEYVFTCDMSMYQGKLIIEK